MRGIQYIKSIGFSARFPCRVQSAYFVSHRLYVLARGN